MIQVHYTVESLDDIVRALEYYHDINKELALAFQREIDTAILQINRSPRAWKKVTDSKRRYLLQKYPYAIIYEIDAIIVIIAVMHLKRKPLE